MHANQRFTIDGIEYDLANMDNLEYVLGKMYDYLNNIGLEKAIKSQKFIRHLHIFIALTLCKSLDISPEFIHFEVKLRNKVIDVGIIKDGDLKVAISLKSQSSSIRKNFTNMVNALQGEVMSLKKYYPSLIVAFVLLLKRKDITEGVDCLNYYMNNVPKKLLPFISYGTKDRFDSGSIIIWDIEDDIVKLEDNYITQVYDLDNLINDIKELYSEELKSQFSLNNLEDRISDFLEPKQ